MPSNKSISWDAREQKDARASQRAGGVHARGHKRQMGGQVEGFFGTLSTDTCGLISVVMSAKEKRREGQGVNVPEHFRNYGK